MIAVIVVVKSYTKAIHQDFRFFYTSSLCPTASSASPLVAEAEAGSDARDVAVGSPGATADLILAPPSVAPLAPLANNSGRSTGLENECAIFK
mmetsp:Transcript_20003/g.32394  ORF Transcript_20003/g.32394 Transcript_20003/m.32394 type:complete len:93 (-) Transcript_20003:641-919(-)|eukprot:CAMPEP_0196204694 /NCGR_PEP_ID=MMETSP0912-20130531/6719_1 /TAXON_ID=49265 /ORGANISM="Thalassiosira rotula, Strain GSO102" /LENGTH=92 /DNA_ID=CAMNT_0041478975 /DNA_START=166 /DNA_END=444 /DNA_ORIENTATION=+